MEFGAIGVVSGRRAFAVKITLKIWGANGTAFRWDITKLGCGAE